MRYVSRLQRWGVIVAVAVLALGAIGCGSKGSTDACAFCEGGCASGSCNVICDGFAICADRTYECPPGVDCVIDCNGDDSCDGILVFCPPGQACTLSCEGVDACGDAILDCGSSDCTMECGQDPLSCEGATVNCGSGACTVTCDGSVPPTVNGCANASSCTVCPGP